MCFIQTAWYGESRGTNLAAGRALLKAIREPRWVKREGRVTVSTSMVTWGGGTQIGGGVNHCGGVVVRGWGCDGEQVGSSVMHPKIPIHKKKKTQ